MISAVIKAIACCYHECQYRKLKLYLISNYARLSQEDFNSACEYLLEAAKAYAFVKYVTIHNDGIHVSKESFENYFLSGSPVVEIGGYELLIQDTQQLIKICMQLRVPGKDPSGFIRLGSRLAKTY